MGDVEAFHDQVGYWLWEPATGAGTLTIAIPRAQVAMAGGKAQPGASSFEVSARVGDPSFGIVSNPFLNHAFRTVTFTMSVTIESDSVWSYEQDTVLVVLGAPEPIHHRDSNRLTKVGEPTPHPMAQATG